MGAAKPPRGHPPESPLLRAFFERRENLVLFLAARTRSLEEAEDLVQDLYLKLAALEPGTEARSATALLYRMAANLMIDHVRSAQRAARRDGQWRRETRIVLGAEEVTAEPAADEAIIARERLRKLSEAVDQLPPQARRAFTLHKLEGRSQGETAQAMGISRKTVEHHIQAAIQQLSRRLRS